MAALIHEKVWIDKKNYDEAERKYFESLAKLPICGLPYTNNQTTQILTQTNQEGEKQQKKKNKQNSFTQSAIADAVMPSKKTRKNKKDKKNKTTSESSQDAMPGSVSSQRSSAEREVAVDGLNSFEKTLKEKTPPPKVVKEPTPPPEVVEKNTTKPKTDKEPSPSKIKSPPSHQVVKDLPTSCKIVKEPTTLSCKVVKEASMSTKNNSNPVMAGVIPLATQCTLAQEVAKARQHIKNSLECMESVAQLAGVPSVELMNRINSLEKANQEIVAVLSDIKNHLLKLQNRVDALESQPGTQAKPQVPVPAPAKVDDDDDGVDLFASDDEEESAEAARVREERLAAYNAKKSKKPVLIAKSNIILDVKPWDDETDMKAMEEAVRKIETDGLLWGAAKLVPLAYGIHKLQISCVVEDDKVSVDWLTEELEKIEDFVQSVDIAAFNKV